MRPQANRHKEGTAFGHAGIVAAASAVLADLERGGILRVLLGGDEERERVEADADETRGEAVGAIMQEKVDTKVRAPLENPHARLPAGAGPPIGGPSRGCRHV
jgi:hypothetical protein